MFIVKSLLRDVALDPYCKKCICTEWSVFAYNYGHIYRYLLLKKSTITWGLLGASIGNSVSACCTATVSIDEDVMVSENTKGRQASCHCLLRCLPDKSCFLSYCLCEDGRITC